MMLASPISPTVLSFPRHVQPFSDVPNKSYPALPTSELHSFPAEQQSKMSLSALPVELIARILELAVHTSRGNETFKTLATVLAVSRRVRHIVIGTPTLWTTVRITDAGVLDSTRQHLQRSGVLPLDVIITVRCRNHTTMPCKEGVDTLMRSLALLQPSMGRWRTLDFNLPSCWLTQEALSTCGAALTHLEALTVRTGHSDRGDWATPLPSVLVHMPRLTEINFHWYNFRWVEPACLASVRTISVSQYFTDDPNLVQELLEMLRACPNVEEVVLDTISEQWVPRWSRLPEFNPVELRELRRLTLRDCGPEKAHLLLRDIRCPNIVSIELASLGNINGLLGVLASELHTLEHVTDMKIVSCDFRAAMAVQLLQKMPSLKTIEFCDCPQMNKRISDMVTEADTTLHSRKDNPVEIILAEGRQFRMLHLPSANNNIQ